MGADRGTTAKAAVTLPAMCVSADEARAEAEAFYAAVAPSTAADWPTPAIDLETAPPDAKLPIKTLLDGAVDPYAPTLLHHLELLGFEVDGVDASNDDALVVDLTDRRGRAFRPRPGVLEIHELVRVLGIDRFAHIREDSIRRTVRSFADLQEVAANLDDEISVTTMYALIADQLSGLPLLTPPLRLSYDEQYFGTGLFEVSASEVVADVGAAEGDSFEKFAARARTFDSYVAFEPDPGFHERLRAAVAASPLRDRVVIETRPVAGSAGEVYFDLLEGSGNSRVVSTPYSDPRMSRWPGAKSVAIESVTLDAYFAEDRVSIVKMDIEGSEQDAVAGASRVIARDRPRLLISAYHQVEDLVDLPRLIRSLDPSYRLFVRSHSWASEADSWPGAFFCETVLYAL